jgi:hypothetical protein
MRFKGNKLKRNKLKRNNNDFYDIHLRNLLS